YIHSDISLFIIIFFLIVIYRCSLRSTFFPYTTLFRSIFNDGVYFTASLQAHRIALVSLGASGDNHFWRTARRRCREDFKEAAQRSEEHTSELQSRFDLVCRLLLEKKK